MDTVQVLSEDNSSVTVENKAVQCPFCKVQIIPEYLYAQEVEDSRYLDVFCKCTNPVCEKTFISQFTSTLYSGRACSFVGISPNSKLDKKVFSSIIQKLSPNFCEIYNQAYQAQQMNLSLICGIGYRKALEFLIKDYIISTKEESESVEIKKITLSQCIEKDIEDKRIKQVAKRATWLGNDETHYIRKWNDKDITDLVNTINLTISWIEYVSQTKQLLKDMPDLQKKS